MCLSSICSIINATQPRPGQYDFAALVDDETPAEIVAAYVRCAAAPRSRACASGRCGLPRVCLFTAPFPRQERRARDPDAAPRLPSGALRRQLHAARPVARFHHASHDAADAGSARDGVVQASRRDAHGAEGDGDGAAHLLPPAVRARSPARRTAQPFTLRPPHKPTHAPAGCTATGRGA